MPGNAFTIKLYFSSLYGINVLYNKVMLRALFVAYLHYKYLNARFECTDIIFSIYMYSHYPFDQNANTFDAEDFAF